MVTLLSDEANAVEATGFQTELPGLLEDSTQLIQGRIIEWMNVGLISFNLALLPSKIIYAFLCNSIVGVT